MSRFRSSTAVDSVALILAAVETHGALSQREVRRLKLPGVTTCAQILDAFGWIAVEHPRQYDEWNVKSYHRRPQASDIDSLWRSKQRVIHSAAELWSRSAWQDRHRRD